MMEQAMADKLFDSLARDKKILFAGAAAVGGMASGVATSLLLNQNSVFASWTVAGALDAALIGAFVVYAQNYYQTKSFRFTSGLRQALWMGALAGFAGGCAALAGMYVFGAGTLGRVAGWAISGAAAGYVVAAQVPNLKRRTAATAGAIGGGLGCLLMNMGLGYTVGVAVTGAAIGLMVALAETMFRKNWLDVEIYSEPLGSGLNLAKPINQFTLTLGADPITVGSGDTREIRLPHNASPSRSHIATIYVDGEKAIFHDLLTAAKTELYAGQPFRFGECQVRLGA
jgi:hypothetical protein